MPSLHSLGSNELQDEGAVVVCNALKESKVSKLKELVLEDNGITVTGAESVAAYLAVTTSLTKIDVSDNNLGSDGEAALQKAVEGRSGFELKIHDDDDDDDDF